MKTANVKRIAAAAAISGSLTLAAIGLGAGAASADNGIAPLVPGGPIGNVESLFPAKDPLPLPINTLDTIKVVNTVTDIANFPSRVLGLPPN